MSLLISEKEEAEATKEREVCVCGWGEIRRRFRDERQITGSVRSKRDRSRAAQLLIELPLPAHFN